MQGRSGYAEAACNRDHEGGQVVAATGERSRDWQVRALISCAALLAAAVLAPGSLASGLIPDPDPNPDPAQPQPDAYQSTPATAPAPAPAAASTETPAPV